MYTYKLYGKNLYLSSVLCSISSFTLGLNLTSLGCIEDVFRGKSLANTGTGIYLSDSEMSSITSVFNVGALFSNLISPYIKLRRKTCLIANNFFYIAGILLFLWANGYLCLLASRILVGIGMGFTCVYVPSYLESVSSAENRGMICSLHQLCAVLGVLMGQVLSFYFNTPENWRLGILLVLIHVSVHTLLLFPIYDADSDESPPTSSFTSLLKNKDARLSVVTAIVLHCAQQLSGINGILFYSNELFKGTGSQRFYTMLVGIAFVTSTVLFMFFADKYGRKPLMLFSILIDIVSLMSLCICEQGQALIPVIIFIIGFSFGLGPIVWFISNEIFPGEYKPPGAALAVTANTALSYAVSRYFHPIFEKYGSISFSFYAFFLMMSFLYIVTFFQETKGKVPAFQKIK